MHVALTLLSLGRLTAITEKACRVAILDIPTLENGQKGLNTKKKGNLQKIFLFPSAYFCSMSMCMTCVLGKGPTSYMDPWLFLFPTFKYTVVPIRSVLPPPPPVQIWRTLLSVARRPGSEQSLHNPQPRGSSHRATPSTSHHSLPPRPRVCPLGMMCCFLRAVTVSGFSSETPNFPAHRESSMNVEDPSGI